MKLSFCLEMKILGSLVWMVVVHFQNDTKCCLIIPGCIEIGRSGCSGWKFGTLDARSGGKLRAVVERGLRCHRGSHPRGHHPPQQGRER